tara:strand:- start:17819 stop:18328 length:510 start_codon:yes stop_codon:yes gene_type:complete
MSKLLQQAELKSLCERSELFSGTVVLESMPRLAPLLAKTDLSAAYSLSFGQDSEKRLVISGNVSTKLKLKCQRCMEDLDFSIELTFCLSPIKTAKESDSLPEKYDPLLMNSDWIAPMDIIEDELILAIPSAPKHEEEDCAVSLRDLKVKDSLVKKESPFAILAKMKRKK